MKFDLEQAPQRSEVNEAITRMVAGLGAGVMLVAFVLFVITAYDEQRAAPAVTDSAAASTPSGR